MSVDLLYAPFKKETTKKNKNKMLVQQFPSELTAEHLTACLEGQKMKSVRKKCVLVRVTPVHF